MCSWSAEQDAGQALVEMALLLLVLLSLVWAVIEGACLMLAWVSVGRAAQAGARFAAVAQWSLPKEERLRAIRQAAVQAAPALDLVPDQIAVYSSSSTTADPNSSGAPGDRVRVVVTYKHRLVTPLFGGVVELHGREETCTEYVVPVAGPPCRPIPTPRP